MPVTKQPSPASVDKLINYVHKREEVKEAAFQELYQRIINGFTTQNIIENNGFYHKQCYSSLTNSEKLKRAEVRFHEAVKQGSSSVTKRKPGRPSTWKYEEDPEEVITTRSKTNPYFRIWFPYKV